MSRFRSLLCVAVVATVACGKEGPPLPPLHLVPTMVTNVVARRSADEVRFSFVLPTKNVNGPGTVNLARVEIYAATVAAGAVTPAERELLTAKNLVGTIEVRQPAPKGAETDKPAPPETPTQPAPGDTVMFVEKLDEAKLKPAYTEMPPPPVAAPAGGPPSVAVPPAPLYAKRVYSILGVARNGRPGQRAPRIELPLVALPPPPTAVAATFTETAVRLSWTAPTLPEGPVRFNVYEAETPSPLNAAPLEAAPFEREGVEFGKEACFVVRSVLSMGAVTIESAAPDRVCVTPVDTFPPKQPTGLNAVAAAGAISLIWNANNEPDLAGYLVLRGEAPGDTLQPLTTSPVKETTFRDTTVKPGVRYVYAIVAVDNATTANASPQSARVEETAR